MSASEQMRRAMRIVEASEPLEEGPLRTLGMAGADLNHHLNTR